MHRIKNLAIEFLLSINGYLIILSGSQKATLVLAAKAGAA